MGGAKVSYSGMRIVELEHVEVFDRGDFMNLDGTRINRMVEDVGAAGFHGFINVVLHDLGTVLVLELPGDQA